MHMIGNEKSLIMFLDECETLQYREGDVRVEYRAAEILLHQVKIEVLCILNAVIGIIYPAIFLIWVRE